jgi:acyl carrier protein
MSGKSDALLVLREHLPLPLPYTPPRNETEAKLAHIWCTVLSMDCIGVFDSYQDLGGDSFLAIVIFGMIGVAFDVNMPMATLISSPTIAAFATKIEQLKEGG